MKLDPEEAAVASRALALLEEQYGDLLDKVMRDPLVSDMVKSSVMDALAPLIAEAERVRRKVEGK